MESKKDNHPLILCVFGLHHWKHVEYKYAGAVAEFGGYGFLPNTEEILECSCRARKSIVRNYKGDVIG